VLREEILHNAHGLASFVWFGNLVNEIKIHPIYLEFLQSKQNILSNEEKLRTYKKAAQWCVENDFYTDAMKYSAKTGQFEQMIKILVSHTSRLPQETSKYFFEIIDGLDVDESSARHCGLACPELDSGTRQSPEALGNQGGSQVAAMGDELSRRSLLFLKNIFAPLLLVGIGKYEQAKEHALAVIEEWRNIDDPVSSVLIHFSYTNLAYIDMYTCTLTHEYNSLKYMEKSMEYLDLASTPFGSATAVFTNPDVRSFACLVGAHAPSSEVDEYWEITKQTALLIEKTALNLYAGYEDLVACECAFYKNQPEIARKYAHSAIMTAREKKQ
jgi:LuxR family maltose regulon positive regulatory protein